MEIPGAAPVASAPAPKPKPKAAPAPKPAYTPPPKPDSRYPVLKGRAIGDKPVDIVELAEDSGIVVIEGTVTGVNEPKELKGGETVLVTFAVYDLTSTIYCKAFYQYRMKRRGMGEEPVPPTDEERQRVKEQVDQIKNGMRVRLRGDCRMDTFLGELSIGVRDMQQMPKVERMDNCEEKRIELHMHTPDDRHGRRVLPTLPIWSPQAARWGHPAVAITDHGVRAGLPRRPSARPRRTTSSSSPACEAYLVDDAAPIVEDAGRPARSPARPMSCWTFETTGLTTAYTTRIIEVGAVQASVDGQERGRNTRLLLCDPGRAAEPDKVTELTGISDRHAAGHAPSHRRRA